MVGDPVVIVAELVASDRQRLAEGLLSDFEIATPGVDEAQPVEGRPLVGVTVAEMIALDLERLEKGRPIRGCAGSCGSTWDMSST